MKDILSRAFQFVGSGDILATCCACVSEKYTDFHVYLPKESFVQRITTAADYGKNLTKLAF